MCAVLALSSPLLQTLQYPTGTEWLYSDLSMITMQVGAAAPMGASCDSDPKSLLPQLSSLSTHSHPRTTHLLSSLSTHSHPRTTHLLTAVCLGDPHLRASARAAQRLAS